MCIAIHMLNSDLFQCVFHIQKLKNDDPLQRAQNIIAKVATPSRAEASVLATHFPAWADSIIRKGNWKRKKTFQRWKTNEGHCRTSWEIFIKRS